MKTHVLDHLRDGQRNINSLLRILERQFISIKAGVTPDYRLMYDIAHYLTYYPDRYHHPYEDLVFRHLAGLRPELSTVVAEIEQQHHHIACEGRRLRDFISEIIDGSVVPRELLIDTGTGYINAYRAHMQTEEDRLLDVLQNTLKSADWPVFNFALRQQPDPVFSEEVSREYQHLRDCISAEGAGDWPWARVKTGSCPVCCST